MHDMDRTQAEFWELDGQELEEESEWMGEEEYSYGELEGVFNEADEMELAAQLLEITDEAELDQFLGGLFKKVGRAVGSVVRSPVGRALGGMLRGVAKSALPMVGGALGNLVVPGLGGAVGSKLASSAGSLFGLELEGLSAEDQEFEMARQYIRLAGEAAKNAAVAPPSAPPQQIAQQALATAASQYAPGLLRQTRAASANGRGGLAGAGGSAGGRRSGRWMRRGNKIVLFGI